MPVLDAVTSIDEDVLTPLYSQTMAEVVREVAKLIVILVDAPDTFSAYQMSVVQVELATSLAFTQVAPV